MMRNEGSMVPNAVIMLPRIPRSRYPIKMDILTARMPGADCDIESRSMKSSLAYPVSFGYDFVFYQRYHSITAADGNGSYLKENGECFKIYIHIQNVVIYFISLSSFPSFPLLAYWLGLILKCFLNTSRKYFASLKPVSSEISVMVCFCSFRSWAACFSRISRM